MLDNNIVVTTQQCLRQRVGQELRKRIISGQLRPGERILQQPLAKEMGVSQSVVREALLEMQFTGLVESVDNLGMFVADINLKKLLQGYQVREMMEGLAARNCCQTASISDIRELTTIAEKVYEHGTKGEDRIRANLDRRFHDRLFEIAQNDVLRRLAGAYHIVRLVVLKDFPHEQVRQDHLRILEAIRANDADGAERAAREHVIKAREMIERQVSNENFDVAIAVHRDLSESSDESHPLAV
jgi:DNA-binding GntR family transcriptional regulator